MATPEQLQAIRQRMGIAAPTTSADTVLSTRQSEIDAAWAPKPDEKSVGAKTLDFLKGSGPIFKASEGGASDIPTNLAKTAGNLPSSARDITRAVIAPVNPFDTGSPVNIGKNIVDSVKAGYDIYKQQGASAGTKSILGGFADTYLKIGETIYGGLDKAYNALLDNPEQALTDVGTHLSKVGIEDPLFIPSLLYGGPKAAGAKTDAISIAAKPGTVPATTAGAIAGETLTKAGTKIEQSGINTSIIEKNKFAQDLVSPVKTKAVKEAEVSRTTETGSGPFKRSIITPTASELRSAQEVAKIPEVSSSNTYQQNYNHIANANTKAAQQLEADISANDFVIPKKEVLSKMNAVKDVLSKSPVIVGDAEKTASKLIAGAADIIAKNSGTGSGLLKAKKEYDAWVLSQKPKVFDASAENAFTIANREIRNVFKDILDTNAPNAKVKESLRSQSALYDAMDNVAPKAAEEADTALMRTFQNIGKKLGTKNKIVQNVAAAVGIAGLGAAIFAPAVAGLGVAGFVIYQGGKLIMKPQVRIAIGKLLQESGHLLNPQDKTILQDALNAYSEMPNKEGGFVSIPGNTDVLPPSETLLKTDMSGTTPKISDIKTHDFSSFHSDDQKHLTDFAHAVNNKQKVSMADFKIAKETWAAEGYTVPTTKKELADLITTAEESSFNKTIK